MKLLGLVFVAIGLALLIFLIVHYIRQSNRVLSPIPDEKGVKVIFVTPGS